MSNATSLPPAGWYPDQSAPGQERWWDGTGWTDHSRAQQVAHAHRPATPPVGSAEWDRQYKAAERKMNRGDTRKAHAIYWIVAILLFVGLPIAAIAAGGTGGPTCGQSGQCSP